ncbi:MAG: methylisocitrate lyase [Rhodospirillales bacterium]|nr:methylisocitrate lyase [Rhodospirillales bacterium]
MTAQLFDTGSGKENHSQTLKKIIDSRQTTAIAGAYDGMSALLAARSGFRALYLSGAALSASMALPDLGLLTLDDVRHAARTMVMASKLPVIVDCDTGFGEILNVMRAVRDLEDAGVACIQIEDQILPKKCGHLNDKRIAPIDDMCRKITAAKKASRNLCVCARTDAAQFSLEDAIERANRYTDAGADIIFVEALHQREHMERVRSEVSAPLLANMTEFGRTPQTSLTDWEALGYELVIFPVSAFRVASRAMERFYESLRKNGDVSEFLPEMMTREELYDRIRYFDYEELDDSIARSTIP